MRTNGHLVVVDAHGVVRFRTTNPTAGAPPYLRVRNTGQLAIFRGDTVVWHTNTHTP
jgi:hypothetical protein